MNVKLAIYIIIPKIMLDFRFRTNSNQILYNIVKTKLTQLYEGILLTRVKLKWFSFLYWRSDLHSIIISYVR